MAKSTKQPSSASVDVEQVLPLDVEVQESFGKITGTPLFRVKDFEMPWVSTQSEALRVYRVLSAMYSNGYFDSEARAVNKA